jgi:hypothetical protein
LRDSVTRLQGDRLGAPKTGFTARDAERSSRYFTDLDKLKQALAPLIESGIVRPRSPITGKPLPDKTTCPSQRNRKCYLAQKAGPSQGSGRRGGSLQHLQT